MLGRKKAIEAIGKKMGLASLNSELGGGNGSISTLGAEEVIEIIYGYNQKTLRSVLRKIASAEKKRLFAKMNY